MAKRRAGPPFPAKDPAIPDPQDFVLPGRSTGPLGNTHREIAENQDVIREAYKVLIEILEVTTGPREERIQRSAERFARETEHAGKHQIRELIEFFDNAFRWHKTNATRTRSVIQQILAEQDIEVSDNYIYKIVKLTQ